MYAGRPMGYLQLEITSILLGTAYAALDEYERIIRERKTMGPNPVPRYQNSDYQRHWGLASGKLLAAEAVLMRMSDYYSQLCAESVQGGAGFDTEKLMTIHASTHHAINLAWEAIEILFRTGGTSEGGRQGSRMDRYWRDFSTARTNAGLQTETFAQMYAKQHFGIELDSLI
jgi:3-hydroxy-9,10-secoandrosta-1,3,5(10)-triene-9,17-dione monooxygenase